MPSNSIFCHGFQAPLVAGNLQAGQVVFVDLAGSERVGKSGVSADGTGGARAFSVLDQRITAFNDGIPRNLQRSEPLNGPWVPGV